MFTEKKIRSFLAILVVLSLVRLVSASGLAADINGDGVVNTDDLVVFAASWLDSACVMPDWCGGADLNKDGDVDYKDFAVLSEQWLDEEDLAAFITTWDTSLGADTTVTLALAGEVNAQIDWGDGTIETVTTAGPHTRDYGIDGIYTVRVTGSATGYNGVFYGGIDTERAKLVSVDNWGQLGFTSLHGAFHSASNLVSVPQNSVGLEAVVNMHSMFFGASIFNSDISNWNTSNVAVMDHMFNMATSFDQDLSGWCVTNISWKPMGFDMGAINWFLPRPIWGTCPSAFVTVWNTSLGAGTTVTLALAGEVNAQIDWGDGTIETVTTAGPHVHDYGINGTYTVKVTGSATAYDSHNYGGTNSERAKLIRVEDWGQLGFTSLNSAFDGAINLVSVPNIFNSIEDVWDMRWMFAYASSFDSNISSWNTSNIEKMDYMFYNASAFNSELGNWNTSNVANMKFMFYGASSFNSDIGIWDTSNVTDMDYMFYGASSFNRDLSGWCVYEIPAKPVGFDTGASSWVLPRPNWGICPAAFTTTWNTILGFGTTVTLALAGDVNGEINWGDGTIQTVTTAGPHTHDYGEDGIYTVRVTGIATAYNSYINGGAPSERAKLISVDNWGRLGFTSLQGAFWAATNLVSVPNNSIGIEAVTSMSSMFYDALSFDSDISQFNTSNVTSMSNMFRGAESFNRDISGWDTSKVTDMSAMFQAARSFNQDLDDWNTSNVTDMSYMFNGAYVFDSEIGSWNTSSVTDIGSMFMTAYAFNKDIGDWDTSKVISMRFLFYYATSFNQYIGDWDTSNVLDMWTMFAYASEFNQGLSGWDTSKVTDMSGMFRSCSKFNQDISGWNTSNVVHMSAMFREASVFNQNISLWDTSKVTGMESMFWNASAFNQDLSDWCVINIPFLPFYFDNGAENWVLPRPIWGTCP